ncbi:hypothetical protein EYF80_047858 [Liparis tanakae]|uniref:Uncharacterized protein n=1 Tax=Liparis tanakae TaxID=230148 RepID=A0A4Z2FMD8_9TELE|nr:hypothetical protein EYF80_047858 [Liparis tanakae]
MPQNESELRIEKAKLEARIDSINLQQEAEAANAEAAVLERAAADMNGSEGSNDMETLPFQECAQKRAYDYVTHHAQGPIEEKDVYPLQPILPPQHDDTAPAQLHIINRRPSEGPPDADKPDQPVVADRDLPRCIVGRDKDTMEEHFYRVPHANTSSAAYSFY